MSDEQYLTDFLVSEVNIDNTRLQRLNDSVNAVMNYVSSSEVFEDLYKGHGTQGSYAHRTIIKPSKKKKEFDADVLVFMSKKEGWTAADYIDQLYKEFRKSGVYREKVRRNPRCVTIDYAGEFHVDVVPYFKRIFWGDQIANRSTNEFEPTDSPGYTDWLEGKNDKLGNDYLVQTIRLLKYLRNIKQTFSVKSVLLTTMVGNQVKAGDGFFTSFDDLPSTLQILLGRLDDWLQENPEMPVVSNPVMEDEDFVRHWDQDCYDNFREKIHLYRGWVDEACDEGDEVESIKKWRKIFGDKYAQGALKESDATTQSRSLVLSNSDHRESLRWPSSPYMGKIEIYAEVFDSAEDQNPELVISSDDLALDKNKSIRFEASVTPGKGQKLYWRVVNTGPAYSGEDEHRFRTNVNS